jgi:hypothetical protein
MGLAHWIIALAGFELVSFLIFGVSIATAIPEHDVVSHSFAPSNPKRAVRASN